MNLLHQIIVVLFLITLELATTDSKSIGKELKAFKKTNRLIVGKVSEPCDTACENQNMYCNFAYYKQLSQEAINKLIIDTVIASEELSIDNDASCKDESYTGTILSADETKSVESFSRPLPYYSEDDTCVYGYIRSDSSRDPPCDDSGEEYHNLCTCRNQSLEFEKTNIVIVSEFKQSCDQTCIKKHFTCSFDEYIDLSQYEIRHLLKKAAFSSVLWNVKGMCANETGDMLADQYDTLIEQQNSYPPYIEKDVECMVQGYKRKFSTTMPDCTLNDPYDDQYDYWLFCSCQIDELASAAPTTSTKMIKPTSAESTNSAENQSGKRTESTNSAKNQSDKETDDTKSDKSLNKLVIAAIVIFVLGLCLIILGVSLFLIHRAKKNEKTKKKSIHGDETSKLYPASVRSVTTKGKPGADEFSRTGKSVQITRSSRHGKSDKKLLGLTSKSSVKKTHK